MENIHKDPKEAAIDTLAAPMTPSLKRFSTKPPVMMPRATAGRFSIPGWMNKWTNEWVDEMDQNTGKTIKRKCPTDHNFMP